MVGENHLVLAINPGSTSTRAALFSGETLEAEVGVSHASEELETGADLWQQLPLRRATVLAFLKQHAVAPDRLDAVVGRGGLLRPVPGGTYEVNDAMLADARAGSRGVHPSNLGCALAHEMALQGGARAVVVDPVSVDESDELAAYSGLADIRRRPLSHALSVRASARRVAEVLGRPLASVNVVVAPPAPGSCASPPGTALSTTAAGVGVPAGVLTWISGEISLNSVFG